MPLLETIMTALVVISGLWNSPVALLPVALVAGYAGWRVVEVIPVTRRIIERREGSSRDPWEDRSYERADAGRQGYRSEDQS